MRKGLGEGKSVQANGEDLKIGELFSISAFTQKYRRIITQYQTYDERILNPLCQILTLRPKDRSAAIKEGDIFHQSHSDAQSQNIWRGNITLMVITQYQSYDERILKTLCAKFLLFDQKIVPQLSKSLEGGIFRCSE